MKQAAPASAPIPMSTKAIQDEQKAANTYLKEKAI